MGGFPGQTAGGVRRGGARQRHHEGVASARGRERRELDIQQEAPSTDLPVTRARAHTHIRTHMLAMCVYCRGREVEGEGERGYLLSAALRAHLSSLLPLPYKI